ncbi:Na+-efflux ABC transporter (ATP-binding protein) [[Clostridium] ultunense Esp]|uniref:ABC transporter ATP-binding protein n=1 Tax=Thermicanus aegyptius TaxID=94009 RepID=UPI0002B708F5|nr:ABC transporter ATP-binding protein [Thermicanus aegyptius]CCQ98658.1 Na+-efflux ABC transporter (ATP-binding protein) [[Clostridium] ultunense Esp]
MALVLEDVTKKFGDFTAVDHLSLTIPEKKIFGLLGANGAGKTTTIRMILGILQPTEGKIRWNGEKIDYSNSHRVGYLPEERGLYPKLTVKEQLLYLARLRNMGKEEALRQIDLWLERFQVPEYKEKKVEELSKGNQQKIQFIAAILHKPELLFMDEPFSGLDPVNSDLLKKVVLDLADSGTTIIFSSHRMEQVEELCQDLVILRRGKPVVQGNLKEIKRAYGKKNIILHADGDLSFLSRVEGVTRVERTAVGAIVKVVSEEVSQRVLQEAMKAGFITKFALEEPSLHEIFVEKVGTSYES